MRRDLAAPPRVAGVDHAVREFAHLKPRLRDDLACSVQVFGDRASYIIEDRVRSAFFRVGVAEFRFMSLLDGRVTVEQALASSAASLGRDAISAAEAATIVRWLIDNELAFTSASRDETFLDELADRRRRAKTMQRANLMFVKVPFGNPDRLLSRVTPYLRFLLGPGFLLLWLAVVASGAYQVAMHWDRFAAGARGFLSVDNWLWIALLWTGLKVVHEFFHGLVCKKYGGEVYEAGMILVLFAPIGYVDATASWRFPSKWQRMHTAAAGMFIEFFIAGVAAWVWQGSESALVQHVAWNVVVIASITTLLFNANPLMKFDGYYVLADFLEIPNLYGEGQRFVRRAFRRWMLGIAAEPADRPAREAWLIGIYGVSSLLWRVVVVATLLFVASTLFEGAGLLIAAASAVILLVVPAARFLRYLVMGNEWEKPSVARFLVAASVLLATVYLLFTQVQVQRDYRAPAMVDFADIERIRAGGDGFVTDVHVRDGDRVEAGALLLTLGDEDLDAAIADLRLQQQQLALGLRNYRVDGRHDAAQALERKAQTVSQRLAELLAQRDTLSVRAPLAGQVVGEDLQGMRGRFVNRGDGLLAIGVPQRKHLVLLIAQGDIDVFRRYRGATVSVSVEGRGATRMAGHLERIEPRASRDIRDESLTALTALAGGPVNITTDGEDARYRYDLPRFEGSVVLAEERMASLRPGEIAEVSVRGPAQSIGRHWYLAVGDWVDGVLSRTGVGS